MLYQVARWGFLKVFQCSVTLGIGGLGVTYTADTLRDKLAVLQCMSVYTTRTATDLMQVVDFTNKPNGFIKGVHQVASVKMRFDESSWNLIFAHSLQVVDFTGLVQVCHQGCWLHQIASSLLKWYWMQLDICRLAASCCCINRMNKRSLENQLPSSQLTTCSIKLAQAILTHLDIGLMTAS